MAKTEAANDKDKDQDKDQDKIARARAARALRRVDLKRIRYPSFPVTGAMVAMSALKNATFPPVRCPIHPIWCIKGLD
jgi:multidrug resistance efflux pump